MYNFRGVACCKKNQFIWETGKPRFRMHNKKYRRNSFTILGLTSTFPGIDFARRKCSNRYLRFNRANWINSSKENRNFSSSFRSITIPIAISFQKVWIIIYKIKNFSHFQSPLSQLRRKKKISNRNHRNLVHRSTRHLFHRKFLFMGKDSKSDLYKFLVYFYITVDNWFIRYHSCSSEKNTHTHKRT